MQNVWVFGYGSLIWHPGFDYLERQSATLDGWRRVFWQGSHDHRGTPDNPGRVVTLVPDKNSICVGMLYLIDAETAASTFEKLDHREKNGYDRVETQFTLQPSTQAKHSDNTVNGIVYIASQQNIAYLGEAPAEEIAAQILGSNGPSGANVDYLFALADSLRELNAADDHVFEIEQHARALLV